MTKAMTSVAAMQLVEQGSSISTSRSATPARACRAAGARRLRRRWLAQAAAAQAADHPAPPADPHRRLRLRHSGTPISSATCSVPRHARHRQCKLDALKLPLCSIPATAGSTASTSTGPARRSSRSAGRPRRVLPRAHLRPARHGGHGLHPAARQQARLASMHVRDADGTLPSIDFEMPQAPEFFMGGGGLYSTGPDTSASCGCCSTAASSTAPAS